MSGEQWTVKKILNWSVNFFHDKGIENPRLNAEWLLCHALNTDRVHIYLDFDKILNPKELSTYRELVKQRIERRPLQYVLGRFEFMGLPIVLNEQVLIPRPETELLVEEAAALFKMKRKPIRILEIGVGSGCIAVGLHHFIKTPITYDGIDISAGALEIARQNAILNELPDTFHFHEADFLSGLPASLQQQPYDLIISNPPYVTQDEWQELQPEIIDHEPKTALVAHHEDPLIFYHRLAGLESRLALGGHIVVELSATHWQEIRDIFTAQQFLIEIKPDYSGKNRILIARRH